MGFLQFFNKFRFKKKSPSLRPSTGRDSPAVSGAHTAGLNDERARLKEGATVDQGVNVDIADEEVGDDSGESREGSKLIKQCRSANSSSLTKTTAVTMKPLNPSRETLQLLPLVSVCDLHNRFG
jgi:hypothetical protein